MITAGEVRLLDRLLWANTAEVVFVVTNTQGIREGRPVWKAWQHRVLAPALVSAIDRVTGDEARSLRIFSNLTLAAANLLVYVIVRRRGAGALASVLAVAVFGLGRLLLVFKLEYPWDGVDVLVFLVFGDAVARGRRLRSLAPLLVVATFNHETAFYLPLWYLLAPLDRASPPIDRRRSAAAGALAFALMAAATFASRHLLYRGRPSLPGQDFAADSPLMSNPIHLAHNLRELFFEDLRRGRAVAHGILLAALAALAVAAIGAGLRGGARRRAGDHRIALPLGPRLLVWVGAVVATIFCFGYTSELRLYLPLLAFGFSFAAAGVAWRPDPDPEPAPQPGA